MLEHLWRLAHRRIFQHLCCQRDSRYRRLKLMCHIVDKIVLHFCQFLLTENNIQRENKRYQQHESKYHRWNHKTHRIKNIIFFSGKVHFYNTHLGRRIVLKKRLGIRVLASFHFKIRTTVYFSSIFIDYCKVVRQFYTIIK